MKGFALAVHPASLLGVGALRSVVLATGISLNAPNLPFQPVCHMPAGACLRDVPYLAPFQVEIAIGDKNAPNEATLRAHNPFLAHSVVAHSLGVLQEGYGRPRAEGCG